MTRTSCVALVLAGGEGKRLGEITSKMAKPAVEFGGKFRLIDFPLSNCTNSGMDVAGVVTQYEPLALHSYIGAANPWNLEVTLLPPYVQKDGGNWYQGTAHAVYQNRNFIDHYNPEYVLILSGDHVYKMDYSRMLEFHQRKEADVTISVIEVPWDDASRYGIANARGDGSIYEFDEKPVVPKSNLASMGIYIFNWSMLKSCLDDDMNDPRSSHDFGKDILPGLLWNGKRLYAYPFHGYWRDVGTIRSLWEANMDLLDREIDFCDTDWPIYSVSANSSPHYIAPEASIHNSCIHDGCMVYGEVNHSVCSSNVSIGEGSVIIDAVIMPGAKIGRNVRIERAIILNNATIEDGSVVGCAEEIVLAGERRPITTDFGKIPGGV
jgi:glucose-1-phosphate adenylyltransferase